MIEKTTWALGWKLLVLLLSLTGLLVLVNGYLVAVATGSVLSSAVEVLGGGGTLGVFLILISTILLLPPLVSWKKSGRGQPVVWCLSWNVGLLIVILVFGPIAPWMRSRGASPMLLVFGADSRVVETLGGELGWGTGQGAPPPREFDGSEAFALRWLEIVKTLKEADSTEALGPVVRQSNLDKINAWSEKKQFLAFKHVRDQIELIEFDAKQEKRQWQLYDFEQTEQTVRMHWRAYKKGTHDDYLSRDIKLIKEDEQWKADFTSEIETFDKIMQRRENSLDR